MILQILLMFGLTFLQNASFTLVSRARNSQSLTYHAGAAVLSNGIWILVIRHVVINMDNIPLMITYVVGTVTGSVCMHYVAMKHIENKKFAKNETT